MTTRTRRSAWTFGSGLVFSAVNFAVTLAAAPWLLRWLGEERFGAYRVLLEWLAYVVLMEMGLGVALMVRIAGAAARGDEGSVRSLLVAGLRAYARVTLGMLAVGLGLAVILPGALSSTLADAEIRLAWLLLLPVALVVPASVFRGMLEARQKGYRINLLLTAEAVVVTVLLLLTARAGWGLPGQALAASLAALFTAAFFVAHGLRVFPGVLRERPTEEATKAVWGLNWSLFLMSLTLRVGLLSDNIIIGWTLGAAAVAPFYLTQRLLGIALTQLNALGTATWAGMAELFGRGDLELFRLRLLDLTTLVAGVGAVILTPILAFNRHFVHLWIGPEAYAGDAVTVLAGINTWMWSVSSLWSWSLSGTGEVRRWIPFGIAFMVLNLVVSVAATFAIGVAGPLFGTAVGFVCVSAWALPHVLRKSFGVAPGALLRRAGAPLVWAVPYGALLWLIASRHTPAGWLGLLGELAAAGAVSLLLWWRLTLDDAQRRLWTERVMGVIGRRASAAAGEGGA